MSEVLTIPRPGRKGGPCRREYCGGELCERLRSMARLPCSICREPIGYDVGYVDQTPDEEFAPTVLAHAMCAAIADGEAESNGAPPFNP